VRTTVVFPRCPLCGGLPYRLALEHRDLGTIVDCRSCGLRYTRARSLESWPALRRAEPSPLPEVILQKEVDQTADYDAVLAALRTLGASGSLLGLGCATGQGRPGQHRVRRFLAWRNPARPISGTWMAGRLRANQRGR